VVNEGQLRQLPMTGNMLAIMLAALTHDLRGLRENSGGVLRKLVIHVQFCLWIIKAPASPQRRQGAGDYRSQA